MNTKGRKQTFLLGGFSAKSSLMDDRIELLSEREKEALRLLLQGHDAKSIARELALSIHSVNERLRSTRQKLGVTSSREAARLLGQSENSAHKFSGDEPFGLSATCAPLQTGVGHSERLVPQWPIGFVFGGILLMSLIVAAVALVWITPQDAGPERAPRWSQITAISDTGSEVRNVVRLDGNRLTWNDSSIGEAELRQFLDISTQMSPQPTLVLSYTAETKTSKVRAIRSLIEDVLQCTPHNCKEFATPPAR